MMTRHILGAIALVCACAGSVAAQSPEILAVLTKDAPKSADHALTGRYGGAFILTQNRRAFDEIALPSGPAQGAPYDDDKAFKSMETRSGKITRTIYVAPPDRSSLEVMTNYRDALSAHGFAPVFECVRTACGDSFPVLKYNWQKKETIVSDTGYDHLRALVIEAVFDAVTDVRYSLLKKSTPEGDSFAALYVAVNSGGTFGDYSQALNSRVAALVEIVEPRVMEKSMVTLSAADIGNKIASDGRAVFNNVLFDVDKAVIKPESLPQIDQMAAFLKSNPALKGRVVGHTDNTGGFDHNLKLSDARAVSVMQALIQRGIDKSRLAARGAGSLSPVATNRTDEGREKNRRVELIEQ